MLNDIRSLSSSILTKLLIVLLIASFALWGVGDMVLQSGRPSKVAEVGDEEIAVDTFFRELSMQKDQIRRSLGTSYSPELLNRLNVPQYVLQRLIQQSLLAQEADRIGFSASDTSVALAIRTNPMFINEAGTFDKARFDAMLRSLGYPEKKYVEKLRREITTDELLHSFNIDVPFSKTALNTLYQAERQPRNVALYRIDKKDFTVKTPTEEDLINFYQDQADLLKTPEYRTVSYVVITAKEEETLQNMIDSLEDSLAAGDTLQEAAKSLGLSVKNAGTFDMAGNAPKKNAANNIPDLDRFIETAFQTDANQESSLIASKGGEYYILYVEKIDPRTLPPLAKIRDKVTNLYREFNAATMLQERITSIQSDINSQARAKSIIETYTLENPIRGSLKRESKTLGGISTPEPFISAVFSTPTGYLTYPVRGEDGSFLIAHILETKVSQGKAPDDKALENLQHELMPEIKDEMMIQYLRHLQIRYPVTVHEDTINQLLKQSNASN